MAQESARSSLQIGIARADITPPVGIRSAGFASRGPLTRHHDPLSATALVAAGGGRVVAIVSCDLLWLDAGTVGEVREAIEAHTQIPAHAIMIACTHTHYGPDPYQVTSDPVVVAYRANLIHTLAGAVAEANANLQPALLGVSWGASDIGVNRREKRGDGRIVLGQNVGGAIDRSVGVLRIDTADGAPLACVVNHQTHPVSQTGSVDHISADYPGHMREVVEGMTGARCLYLQGACGNINAAIMEPHYEAARTLGTRLGCEVVRVWETISPTAVEEETERPWLGARAETVGLPGLRYGSAEHAEALVRALEQELAELASQDVVEGRIRWTERRLERTRAALENWRSGALPDPVDAEVQALRIGRLGLVSAPGEIFTEIGVEVKARSPFAETFFVSCANGSIGYVPVAEAYAEGGYEVEDASRVDPGAAAILVESCLDRLRALA
ncbi:MAG: hypothetical protein JXA09_15875 [Anaerolineae bacterium]|nr:hypothetical protein [Anaerolineae bacterium]